MNNTSAMDLIFCRNVLLYFVPEQAQLVRQRLRQALVEGGWLVVAASELSQQHYAQFTSVGFPGAFVYRRDAQPHPGPRVLLPLPAIKPVLVIPAAQAKTGMASPAALDLALTVRGLANRGQLPEALAACENALASDKLDSALHYLHASILQEQQQATAAQAALNRALYLDPTFVLAHFALGMVARQQGQPAAAEKSFKYTLGLLNSLEASQLLPEGEGLTAGRLMEIVSARLRLGALPG
jgi:chemotaxis protein methyltransferase CheR